MNLKKLETFVMVIDKGSFSAAAAYFSVSQPAVSQQIRSLEEDLQVTLLEREVSYVLATPAGRYVYNKGKALLTDWEALSEGVRSYQGVLSGRLQIGASTIPDAYLLPKWLAVFHKKYPEVALQVSSGDSRTMFTALQERRIHIAVTAAKPTAAEITSHPVAEDAVVLIAPNHHPLTRIKEPYPETWLDYDFVIRERGAGTRDALENMLAEQGVAGKDLRVGIQVGSTEALIAAVEQGLGLSVVSELAVARAIQHGRISKLATINPLSQSYYCCYLQKMQDHAFIQAFRDVVL